jgi:arabinofuranosyltransferase
MRAAWRPALVILAVLSAAGWGTVMERRVTSPGFPLDDTWIHLQFARNVAEGEGFSFNPGVSSSGSSAPLWTLVLALPLALGVGPIASAKVLGIILVAVTALSASELARRLSGSPWAGLLAGLAVAVTPRMVWAGLSGMEAPLYTALATLAMVAYGSALDNPRASRGFWGLLAGLAGWARPETFVAAAILAAAWFLGGARDGARRLVPGWWRPLLVLAVAMAAFVAFNLYVGGRPLPNTFYAKNYGMGTAVSLAEGRPFDALIDAARYPWNLLGDSVWWQASHDGLLFGAALPGMLLLAGGLGQAAPRGGRALLAVLVFTPIAKGLVAPQPPMLVHDGRYVLHLLVLGLVVCACGVAALARIARPRWVVSALAVAGLVQIGGATVSAMDTYAAEVKNINDLQVRTGHWIAGHTSPDARVATNDIGAIAFFSRRFILDTEGLVTPDAIWDKRMWRIDRFFERSQPDVVVIFPHWYPYLAERPSGLTEVARLSAKLVIAGGETLVVYRTPWTRPGRLRAGTYSNR